MSPLPTYPSYRNVSPPLHEVSSIATTMKNEIVDYEPPVVTSSVLETYESLDNNNNQESFQVSAELTSVDVSWKMTNSSHDETANGEYLFFLNLFLDTDSCLLSIRVFAFSSTCITFFYFFLFFYSILLI